MRTIVVSTNVFARIWASRRDGEESEDAILKRLLPGSADEPDAALGSTRPDVDGHTDRRFGVRFPAAFEIFRTYLGREYRARAVSTGWVLDNDGKTYPSLNALSKAVGAKIENAWLNWFYMDGGQRKSLSTLRDPTRVGRRGATVDEA